MFCFGEGWMNGWMLKWSFVILEPADSESGINIFCSNKQMMKKRRLFGWRSSSAFQKGSPGSTQRQKQQQLLQVMISQPFTLPYLFHLEIGIMWRSNSPNIPTYWWNWFNFLWKFAFQDHPIFFRVSSIFWTTSGWDASSLGLGRSGEATRGALGHGEGWRAAGGGDAGAAMVGASWAK